MPAIASGPRRIAAMALVALALVQLGGDDDGPTMCLFRRCTGGYCPGCGGTRAARHLVAGQLGAAWRDHPWVVLAALQATIVGLVVVAARQVGRAIAWRRHLGALALLNLTLVIGVWVVRQLTWPPTPGGQGSLGPYRDPPGAG